MIQMITLMDIYDAFLAKVNEDDWSKCYSKEDLEWYIKDWRSILNSAIPYFKFPRCGLEIDEEKQIFIDENMSQDEVQVLAVYMKQEWLKRTIDSWENIKTQYEESDFSLAFLLKNFISLRQQVITESKFVESVYYRSIKKKPFKYSRLAGGNHGRLKR